MSFIIKGGGAFINTSIAGNIQQIIPSFNPLDLGSKLTLWLDEREQTGSPNVTTWGDQSSYGTHDFLAPPGAPYLGGQVGYNINGYAAPHFVRAVPFFGQPSAMKGYTWYLSNIITSTAYHAYAVVNIANVNTDWSPGGQNEGFCSEGSGGAWWPFTFKANGGNPQLTSGHYASGWKTVYTSGLTLNTNLLLETWYDGTNVYACIANGPTGSVAAGTLDGDLSSLVMRIGTNSGISGSVGTFLACNQVLNNTERANVRQYLGTKYGVSY